ncbi:MAG: pgsA [Homoserinimonas sp.]|nr:pgsA [Homoserinimonas sp.]
MSASDTLRGRFIRKGDTPASIGNLANVITVVRIALAPVFFWLMFLDEGEFGPVRYAAAALFVLAIATDSLDGIIARRQNLVTDLGKILDPIADKLLTGGALVCLSVLGELAWWVTGLILLRELGITLYRMAVLRNRVIPASRGGKLKTVLQAVAITLFLVPLWVPLGDWMHGVNAAFMTAAVIATIVSGGDYLIKAWQHGRSRV